MEHDGHTDDQCIAPPALSDIALMAAIDGEGDAETFAHLEQCPACARRAEALQHFQSHLRARLYRLFCPSTDELIDFHLGLLPNERLDVLRQHLVICPHCSAELETFRSVRPGPYGPAPPPYWRVVNLFA